MRNHYYDDISDIANLKKKDVETNITNYNLFMKEHTQTNEPDIDIGMKCTEPYTCDFWPYCTKNLPRPNIFDISGNMRRTTKFQKYYEGKISFEDLQYEDLNPKYLEQIDFELNNLEPKINKAAIKELLDSLKYPLYFLDYESYQPAIPEIVGTKAYQQLTFQYSLHIIKDKGAPIEHKEFLADDELERINNNMVDFMVPFKQRIYYCKEMQGSASIKAVLPALYPDNPKLDYHKLPLVHNGTEASNTFLSLKGKTKEEQKAIRHGLLVYCELDTYAMVKIWERFKEIVGEE